MIMLIGIQLQLDGYLLKKYLFLVVLRLHCRAGFSPPVVRAAGRGGVPSSCSVRDSHCCGPLAVERRLQGTWVQ